MTTHRITFAAVAVIIITLFAASLLKIQLAQALADASSSAATTSTITAPVSTSTVTPPAAKTAPSSLKLVHIIGTKFIDYCTDGTKVTAYPGDPSIDAHFNIPDAPTPKCPAGQKWDHTSGMDKYDSGNFLR